MLFPFYELSWLLLPTQQNKIYNFQLNVIKFSWNVRNWMMNIWNKSFEKGEENWNVTFYKLENYSVGKVLRFSFFFFGRNKLQIEENIAMSKENECHNSLNHILLGLDSSTIPSEILLFPVDFNLNPHRNVANTSKFKKKIKTKVLITKEVTCFIISSHPYLSISNNSAKIRNILRVNPSADVIYTHHDMCIFSYSKNHYIEQ